MENPVSSIKLSKMATTYVEPPKMPVMPLHMISMETL